MPGKKDDWTFKASDFAQGFSEDHLRSEYFALKKLLSWFDWMKKNNIYNNTEIILVSDHDFRGDSVGVRKLWIGEPPLHVNGLLLVKDFGAQGELKIDRTSLMGNWDVATIILNSLATDAREKHFPWQDPARERMSVFGDWRRESHGKTTFNFTRVYTIQGPLYQKESWKKLQ